MKFPQPLIAGTLLRRYQRFLVDVQLSDGSIVTAHCPNSGSMKSCCSPGWPVRLSYHPDPKRRLRYGLEMVHNGNCWIGVNTFNPNKIIFEALVSRKLPEFAAYNEFRREIRWGNHTRFDLLAQNEHQQCYIEVKNVTLLDDVGYYRFPDAVTTRGQKHLRELMDIRRSGHRAVMLFVIQRSDGLMFAPADDIDPTYGELLRLAYAMGIELLAYQADVAEFGIELGKKFGVSLLPSESGGSSATVKA